MKTRRWGRSQRSRPLPYSRLEIHLARYCSDACHRGAVCRPKDIASALTHRALHTPTPLQWADAARSTSNTPAHRSRRRVPPDDVRAFGLSILDPPAASRLLSEPCTTTELPPRCPPRAAEISPAALAPRTQTTTRTALHQCGSPLPRQTPRIA